MGFNFGAKESRDTSFRIYLNLRTGKLSETSKTEKEGFKPFVSKNASGQEYPFFAKTYDSLTGFITNIAWHEFDYEGKKIVGWNITLDTQDGKEYVLQINSGDRPYQQLMEILPNVDFNEPIRIVAFMGKDEKTQKNQKVLLFTQNPDEKAKDWVKPAYRKKWLSTLLNDKVKQNIPIAQLTEEEKNNLEFLPNGMVDNNFPYIRQKKDGTWSFDAWNDFLIDQMNEIVIPRVEAATFNRNTEQAIAVDNSPIEIVEDDDDQIPF